MTVGGIWVFVFGCAGGFVAEYVGVWNLRKEEPHLWPAYFKRFRYYAISAVMVLMGGGLAVIYGMNPMPATLALNIGASAPCRLVPGLDNSLIRVSLPNRSLDDYPVIPLLT